MACIFIAAATEYEPGKIAVQVLFSDGSVVVRPTIAQARELLSELTTAIDEAEKLVAPAEAAA